MKVLIVVLATLFVASCNIKLTNRLIKKKVKNNILATDDFDGAYALFQNAYKDTSSSGLLQATKDIETYRQEQSKQKKLFNKSLKEAKEHNKKYERGESSYKMTVNGFFIMDSNERRQYLGLKGMNASSLSNKFLSAPLLASSSELQALPTSFDWNKKGYVTAVKNQGSCGSCWTYGAVGPIEYIYKKVTGNLVQLSEQELLDCTYESSGEDGCDGGWYNDAWDFIIGGTYDNGKSHLATQKNYPYVGKDGICSHGAHANALDGLVQLTGYVQVRANENDVLRAVAFKMPLAVAFTVENDFYIVGEGIYDGCTTTTYPNHAVVMTGYGANYFEIKNSWGQDWANDGYAKLARGRDICGILSYAYYVDFKNLSGDSNDDSNNDDSSNNNNDDSSSNDDDDDDSSNNDDDSDYEPADNTSPTTAATTETAFHTSATPTTTEGSNIDRSLCYNYKMECNKWANSGYCTEYVDYMSAYCKDSCNNCRCADNPDVSCAKFKRKRRCTSKKYADYMALHCPVTCGICEECQAGFYTDAAGCVRCPKGTYSSAGSQSCTKCPDGKSSPAGSTKKSDCKTLGCKAGYYKSDGVCIICPKHTYSTTGNVGQCTTCPDGKITEYEGSTSADDCISAYVCEDTNVNCPQWATEGYCTSGRYVSYMALSCEKSCNTCNECKDLDSDCGFWDQAGYCSPSSTYKDYMDTNCKETCGLCDDSNDGSDKNDDSDGGDKNDDSDDNGNDDNNGCPGGLILCNGVCKHEHMCKYD